jgi:hypothetical protein
VHAHRLQSLEAAIREVSCRRYEYSEHNGPAVGWGIRRRVRFVTRCLEKAGYTIVVRAVGRQGRLSDAGLLQPHYGEDGRHQDRLGMGAVVVAEREHT